jgi:plastocyanin
MFQLENLNDNRGLLNVIEEHTLTILRHRKKLGGIAVAIILVGWAWLGTVPALAADEAPKKNGPFFLPSGDAAKVVTVTKTGEAQAGLTMLSEAVAVKETGPKSTVNKFGEVYAFSPAFIAVHRDQPTQIEFWNLQPDDEHDFALVGPDLKVLMYVKLAPLQKTSYIFTFHKEGVIDFKCLRHQPAMSGQILVLPPAK